jgi:hypothetical protein
MFGVPLASLSLSHRSAPSQRTPRPTRKKEQQKADLLVKAKKKNRLSCGAEKPLVFALERKLQELSTHNRTPEESQYLYGRHQANLLTELPGNGSHL